MPRGGLRTPGPGKTNGRPRSIPDALRNPLTQELWRFVESPSPNGKSVAQLLSEILVARAREGDMRAMDIIFKRVEGAPLPDQTDEPRRPLTRELWRFLQWPTLTGKSVVQLLVEILVAKALKGDMKAMGIIFKRVEDTPLHFPPGQTDSPD